MGLERKGRIISWEGNAGIGRKSRSHLREEETDIQLGHGAKAAKSTGYLHGQFSPK